MMTQLYDDRLSPELKTRNTDLFRLCPTGLAGAYYLHPPPHRRTCHIFTMIYYVMSRALQLGGGGHNVLGGGGGGINRKRSRARFKMTKVNGIQFMAK